MSYLSYLGLVDGGIKKMDWKSVRGYLAIVRLQKIKVYKEIHIISKLGRYFYWYC
jgi:hypothetical protein